MVENNGNNNVGFDLDSKFLRVLLILAAVFLLFAGPTYVPYLLSSVLNVGSVFSVVAGAVLFAVGFVLLVFLVRKKVIT